MLSRELQDRNRPDCETVGIKRHHDGRYGPDDGLTRYSDDINQEAFVATTVSDFVMERLHAWGVRRIYGYPGDGIMGLMSALQTADGTDREIRFVQARHEEEAAFMACAHAKW